MYIWINFKTISSKNTKIQIIQNIKPIGKTIQK